MPNFQQHLAADEYLRASAFINYKTNGRAVHTRLDRNVSKYGPKHRELDDWHSVKGIRRFITNMVRSLGNINQETRTDYVRIAAFHIVLDETYTKEKERYYIETEEHMEEIYKKAFRNFKKKGFHRLYYREPEYV